MICSSLSQLIWLATERYTFSADEQKRLRQLVKTAPTADDCDQSVVPSFRHASQLPPNDRINQLTRYPFDDNKMRNSPTRTSKPPSPRLEKPHSNWLFDEKRKSGTLRVDNLTFVNQVDKKEKPKRKLSRKQKKNATLLDCTKDVGWLYPIPNN